MPPTGCTSAFNPLCLALVQVAPIVPARKTLFMSEILPVQQMVQTEVSFIE